MPDGVGPAYPPYVLPKRAAARYVGMSETLFDQRVRPHVPAVILSTGRIGWRRVDLERWADGLPLATSAEAAPVDQAEAAAQAGAAPEHPHARDPHAAALAALAPRRRPGRQAPPR